MASLDVRGREWSLGVGGRVCGARRDVVDAQLARLGEVVALEELIACNLVVIAGVASQMVVVLGSRAVVLGYHGRRVSAVLEAGGLQCRATCCAGLSARRMHCLRALGLFGARRVLVVFGWRASAVARGLRSGDGCSSRRGHGSVRRRVKAQQAGSRLLDSVCTTLWPVATLEGL